MIHRNGDQPTLNAGEADAYDPWDPPPVDRTPRTPEELTVAMVAWILKHD